MKKYKHLLISLVVTVSMVFASIGSFAATGSDLKPAGDKSGNSNVETKQLVEYHISDKEKAQLEKLNKKSAKGISTDSYSNPVTDSEDYLELYYPEPWDQYCIGNSMSIDYSVFDTWAKYYTTPLSGVFDYYDNLIDLRTSDVANVNEWTNFTGTHYFDPSKYSPGVYQYVIFNVPCYSNGVPVDGWADWDNIPSVRIYFELVNHSYGAWKTTKKATELAAGKKVRTCVHCGKKITAKIAKRKPSLPAITIVKPKTAKKAATVKWKKISKQNRNKIGSVQIQYSTDKKFRKGVKTVTAKKTATSKKIKNLKSKKTYYVRIRAYKKSGGKVHISKWSTVKSVKVK